MKYYNLDILDVLKNLNSRKEGLSTSEVQERLKFDGKNCLEAGKKETNYHKFLNQFQDLMIIILILAAFISFLLSLLNNESFMDSLIILGIVFLNAILGFIQELKADKAIEALKKMQVTKVKVKRNQVIEVVNSEEIVKGDILVLDSGDTIPADCRIIWESSLKVDESSLTGESIPISKDIKVLDENTTLSARKNMIYAGTNIVYGKCIAVVCETGMDTEFGLIAKSLNREEKEITPLQKKINGISKFLSGIIAIIIFIMLIVGLIKGMGVMEVIMLSISLAVAAIPEGLPAVITITLSLGMSELAKKKAIVRRMSSVETLGCTEVICSDKTGTITQNKMKVREVFYNDKLYSIDALNSDNILAHMMVLNNDVSKNKEEYIGDPTEIALYECLEKKFNIDEVRNCYKRVGELPFDSDRKMMSTIHEYDNELRLYTKGSFDSLIDRCSYIYLNNEIVNLTDEKRRELKGIEMQEANKAYRILAYAYKIIDNKLIEENNLQKIDNNIENDLIFIGLTAMIDPPREDVKVAIQACKSANIKPIMITGDSLLTATAIAKEVGILEHDNEAITGIELDKLSPEELRQAVKKYSVYARVSPMNKLAIVNAWKENHKVVAMTGDGVNDAPALKAANIGIGMGITGTEVSKGVSDIVLADDSFSTIVTAVKEGRRIFDNIRNVLVYLLTGNITEILVVFIGMLFGIEIFLPIQLLYINLITDGIPAIALAFEQEEKNIMKRKVRKKDSSFFTPFLLAKISLSSLLKTIAILGIYFINLKLSDIKTSATIAFLTLVLLEMIWSYSCRNLKQSIINKDIFSNKYLNNSIILLGIIQLIIFITPLGNLFNIATLNIWQVISSFLIVLLVFILDELSKKRIHKLFHD